MKTKGILIAKIAFLLLILASFIVLEDPLVRKCRKAELVVSNLENQELTFSKLTDYKQKLEIAKNLIQISHTLKCQLESRKKTGTEVDSLVRTQTLQRIKTLRTEASTLLDEIILDGLTNKQLAVFK